MLGVARELTGLTGHDGLGGDRLGYHLEDLHVTSVAWCVCVCVLSLEGWKAWCVCVCVYLVFGGLEGVVLAFPEGSV